MLRFGWASGRVTATVSVSGSMSAWQSPPGLLFASESSFDWQSASQPAWKNVSASSFDLEYETWSAIDLPIDFLTDWGIGWASWSNYVCASASVIVISSASSFG
jgi:hypothetical protein